MAIPEYKTFSHQHNVRLYDVQQGDVIHCSGCQLLCSGSVFVCWQCKFFLHDKCGNAKRGMEHPSHPIHHLTLMPHSTHHTATFTCNACGGSGSALCYCCPLCDFDLHLPCAFLPEMIKHQAHPHELSLTYGLPVDQEGQSHLCDICDKQLDCKLWSYNCSSCDYLTHISCATGAAMPSGTVKEQNVAGATQADQPESQVVKMHREMLDLQLQMQMSHQFAMMCSSFNPASFI